MSASNDDSGKETDSHGRFRSRSERDLALTQVLRAEDAVTTARLLELNFSERELRGLVAHGDLTRIHRGVYVDGRTRLPPWGHLKAALLATAPSSFLSHRSGAAARRYRPINTREIHVSVVAEHTPKIPGLILHRTTEPARGEVTLESGLHVATLPRILVELAALPTTTDRELNDLITQGERRGALGSVASVLDRHGRRPGIKRLRELLKHHITTPGGNSNFEEPFWAWYGTQPDLPPPDDINIHLGPFEFDGIWHKERLVLELDSREYHQSKADMEKDRLKDIYVQRHGYRIVRITTDRFDSDKASIRADLLAFLSQQQAA